MLGALSAGACATSLHQPAVCMLAAYIISHRMQAARPRLRPKKIMKQCSTHASVLCALWYGIPYHRGGMPCVCMSIFSFKQSLSTRHHTPYGRGQLLGDPRPLTWAHRQREWMDRTDEDAIKKQASGPVHTGSRQKTSIMVRRRSTRCSDSWREEREVCCRRCAVGHGPWTRSMDTGGGCGLSPVTGH